ncbi:MAG: glycosyltransferase family 39 protein [Anaerolineae bacterium]|nr:glycosyltransferase family 39 protein [Anaerolineae bacterium]
MAAREEIAEEGILQESRLSSIADAPPLPREAVTSRPAAAIRWKAWTPRLLVGAIVLAALALRLFNVNWDDTHHVHPDERWIMMVATDLRWPSNWLDALRQPHNTQINPVFDFQESRAKGTNVTRHFAYGHLPLYLLMAVASLLQSLGSLAKAIGLPADWVRFLAQAPSYDGYPLVGRIISAILDTGTVFLVYLLGKRTYGRAAGILAAAFSAFTVTQIQLSHFYAFDPVATFFIILSVYGGVRMVQEGRARDALLTGMAAGLGISSKFSALPILAPFIVGAAYWGLKGRRSGLEGQNGSDSAAASALAYPPLARALQLFLIAAMAAFLAFAITSPFAILDWKAFRQSVIEEQGAMVRGIADFPFTRQYRGTAPFLYNIEQQVRWGMGWPLGIVAFIGFAWAVVRALLRKARVEEWIILAWVVPYFGLTGLFMVKFMRYMLPVVPLFSLFGAGMLVLAWEWARTRRLPATETAPESLPEEPLAEPPAAAVRLLPVLDVGRFKPAIARAVPIVAGVTLVGSILWALAFVAIYTRSHTWIQASRWIYQNVPDGSTLVWELWDDPLPLSLPEPRANSGERGYKVVSWGAVEEDTAQKFQIMKDTMRQADYLTFSSKRIYGAVDNLPRRYPMAVKYYELLFAGKLGYELAAEITSYPTLGPFVFPDRDADESFTLYDHPRVLIFRKVRDLSDEEWQQLLGNLWQKAVPGDTGPASILERIPLPGLSSPNARREPAPSPASRLQGSKTLLLDRPVDTLPVVNDFRWNPLASTTIGAVVFWWLAVFLIGLIAWPLTYIVFGNLRDRGYVFARGLGILIIAYINWLLASLRLMRNALPTLLLAALLVAVCSGVLLRRHWPEMRAFLRAQRGLLLVSEAVFSGAFLFFVLIRLGNPDLWQPWNGGEKFMEFAFLNAILRSPYFPPYDPYFAGGYINYYYYGQYVVATLIKLTGITPSVAFNLAIPTLFALTFAGAFSIVYNLAPAQPRAAAQKPDQDAEGGTTAIARQRPFWLQGVGLGLVGGAFVVLLGNLDAFGQVLRGLGSIGGSQFRSQIPLLQPIVRAVPGFAKMLGSGHLPDYDFWAPSRVIPYTINEFPYWSFLFADLHPHMIGIPFTILFIGLTLNLVLGYGTRVAGEGRLEGAIGLLVLPLALGALATINTWDLPTYLGLAVLAFLVREYRGRGTLRIVPVVNFVVGLGVLTYLLYYPFFRYYVAIGSSGIGLVKTRDEVGRWLNMWGFFFFLAAGFVLVELRRPGARLAVLRWLRLLVQRWETMPRLLSRHRLLVRQVSSAYVLGRWALGGVLILVAVALILKYTIVALLLLPLAGAAILLLRRDATAENLFTTMLIFTALLVAAGVQIVFLRDFLQGGEYYRMNTLFKFFIQVWVLLGIGTAAALPRIFAGINRWRRAWRGGWVGVFGALLVASLAFPILGTPARLDDRFPGPRPVTGTLDGMAFMTVGTYNWPDGNTPIHLRYDYDAIQWLLQNVKGSPVVAEVAASWYNVNGKDMGVDYYRAGGLRVSSMTGFPTFIGQHQGEQRYDFQTGQRENLAREFFQAPDEGRTWQLINELRVGYIYVGQLERLVFVPETLSKFDRMVQAGQLRVAYRNDGVTIYAVVKQ